MAKKKKPKKNVNAEIDWYLISIDRLKQIGLVVLLLLLGGTGYWFWYKEKSNPARAAESAISDARQALNTLAASVEFNAHRGEFNRAQQKLDEANAHLAAARFDEAQGAAIESQSISRSASDPTPENDARFLTVEGDVKYQKGSAGEWREADARTALFNGDWVKTGARASAELIFANGSLYTVGPNALLEIFSAMNPGTSKKNSSVKMMEGGQIEVATTGDASTVNTPGTQIIVESESITKVGVDRASKETSVIATRGGASVAPEKGGEAVRVASGEKVRASAQGALGQVTKFLLPPALLSPGDNQVFQLSPQLQVDMVWDEQPGASGYVLQVSRSRLFSTQEINTRRTKTTASAKVTSEGAFYWRVAAIGVDGEPGPFSLFRRFRVAGGSRAPEDGGDKTPPILQLRKPFSIGGQFYIIAGTTEPGALVFIDNEEVDVESNGAFQKLISFGRIGRNDVVIKAVDAAGNQKVESQTVMVEE